MKFLDHGVEEVKKVKEVRKGGGGFLDKPEWGATVHGGPGHML
jgi:hypothetical protein